MKVRMPRCWYAARDWSPVAAMFTAERSGTRFSALRFVAFRGGTLLRLGDQPRAE